MPVTIPVTDLPDLPELLVFEWQWPQVVLFTTPKQPADWVKVMERTGGGVLAFTEAFLDIMAGSGWNGHQKFICTLVGQAIGGPDPGWYEHMLDYWGGRDSEPELAGFPDELDVAPQAAKAFLQTNYWKMAERGATEPEQVRDVLREHLAGLWLPRQMLLQFHDRLVLDQLNLLETAKVEHADDGSLIFRRDPEGGASGYFVYLVTTGLPAEDAIAAVDTEGGLIPEALHYQGMTAALFLPDDAAALAERRLDWNVARYEP